MGSLIILARGAATTFVALIAALALSLPAAEEPPGNGRPSTLKEHIVRSIDHTLGQFESEGDIYVMTASLEELFDQVIAHSGDPAIFIDVASALRTVRHVGQVDSRLQQPLLQFLRKNRELATTLAFLVKETKESPREVYSVLEYLRSNREKEIGLHPALTAALCVVHDGREFSRKVNETEVVARDLLAIFDYFVANQSKMVLRSCDLPPELLIHVVDTTARVDEMEWALKKYAGNTNVGGLFFNVKYDYRPISGKVKVLSRFDYTLQNILTYGGACGDQTYFASTVGKALGIPTTYCHGVEPTTGGHSWVGFLKKRGERLWWTFDIGRYPIHRGIPGKVTDPQTRRMIPESFIALTGEVLEHDPVKRRFASAALDAARRLLDLHAIGFAFAPPLPSDVTDGLKISREGGVAGAVSVLDLGIRQYPYDPEVLLFLAGSDEVVRWLVERKSAPGEYVTEVLKGKYPEFLLEVFKTLIATLQRSRFGLEDQYRLWEGLFRDFVERPDLAAEVRFQQGKLWEGMGNPGNALGCYRDVCEVFQNDSYIVVPALVKAQEILMKEKDEEGAVILSSKTWKSIRRPRLKGTVVIPTNWYQVGRKFEALLRKAGRTSVAGDVKRDLDAIAVETSP